MQPEPAPLTRYWIEFDISTTVLQGYATMHGVGLGCGVTAHSHDDALKLIRASVFWDGPVPPISDVVADVDVSTLDDEHVLPRIGDTDLRGVWFPRLLGAHPA